MINNYQNNNLNLDDFKDCLKILVEIISKPPRYILSKLNNIHSQEVEKYRKVEIHELKNNMDNLLNKMDSISNSLKKNKMFNDEYFDFCEIQDMTIYTINRDISLITESDLEFILNLLKDFIKIIDYKITLVENNVFDDEKFEIEYNSYLTEFNNRKTYFYTNIYNESIDEELFIEYTNIIVR